MKTVTFIIPACDSQDYLEQCLDSFLIDEKSRSRMEVIIVNDGSRDRTPDIAQNYVGRYPDVYRLINKKNGGHGSAINAGADAAKGKYLKVVDADDWVITENLKSYLAVLENCDSDVVLTPYQQIDLRASRKTDWRMYCRDFEKVLTPEDIMADWRAYERCMTLPGIAYRTDFYRRLQIRLPEKIYYEDQEYVALPCSMAGSFYPADIAVYQYRVGISGQSISDQNRLKRISHVYRVITDLLDCYDRNNGERKASKEYLGKVLESSILSFFVITLLIQPDKKRGRTDAGNFYKMIKNRVPSITEKVRVKYVLYVLMNYLHVSHAFYQKILCSRAYRMIRGLNRTEGER